MELGYMLKEGVWTLEAMSVDAEEVLKASYEKWTNLFRSLRMHGEEVAAAKAEAIRLQEEEAARLLKDRQELEAREAALKEAEAKMRASVNEAMKNELLATDQRVAMDGDKELVRQCLLVVQNAGTKLKEIAPRVNAAALKDKVEQTMEMLRNCYVELNKLQQ
jgi:ATP-dependent DNA ligase